MTNYLTTPQAFFANIGKRRVIIQCGDAFIIVTKTALRKSLRSARINSVTYFTKPELPSYVYVTYLKQL